MRRPDGWSSNWAGSAFSCCAQSLRYRECCSCSRSPPGTSRDPWPEPQRSLRDGLELSELAVVVDAQRRMVGEALGLVDGSGRCFVGHARCGKLIVNAPADVFCPCLAAAGPPGILFG